MYSKSPEYVKVQVGSNKLSGDDDGQIYQAEYATYHKGFSYNPSTNDIGLLRVDKDIVFSPKVQPINLTNYDISDAGASAVLSGWGSTRVSSK